MSSLGLAGWIDATPWAARFDTSPSYWHWGVGSRRFRDKQMRKSLHFWIWGDITLPSTTFVSPSTIPEGPSPYMKIHPMVAVLPKRAPTDRKKRTFSEENEGCCFWPVYVGRESAKDRRTLDLGNNSFLITEWVWPTVDGVASPVNPDREAYPYIDPNRDPHIYMRRDPTLQQKGNIPQILFDVEPPRSLQRVIQTRPGRTNSTRIITPTPYRYDSDDEDITTEELLDGFTSQHRSDMLSAQPLPPAPCTFSTTRGIVVSYGGLSTGGPSNPEDNPNDAEPVSGRKLPNLLKYIADHLYLSHRNLIVVHSRKKTAPAIITSLTLLALQSPGASLATLQGEGFCLHRVGMPSTRRRSRRKDVLQSRTVTINSH
jgi:hypothetical protein